MTVMLSHRYRAGEYRSFAAADARFIYVVGAGSIFQLDAAAAQVLDLLEDGAADHADLVRALGDRGMPAADADELVRELRFAGVILDYFTEQGLSSQLLGTLGGLWGTPLTPAAPVAGRGA